jgi:hypothetical protein
MRVRVTRTRLYTYPDVVALCDKPQFMNAFVDTLLTPSFLAQDDLHVDLFTRREGCWALTEAGKPEDKLDLYSIGCKVKMADLYEDISLRS